MLDEERRKFLNANKITNFVSESIQLETQKAFKQAKLNSIEIMRHDSFEGFQTNQQ